MVNTADIQDRHGAPRVPASIRASFPWLRHVFAYGGYAGEKLETALRGNGELPDARAKLPQVGNDPGSAPTMLSKILRKKGV